MIHIKMALICANNDNKIINELLGLDNKEILLVSLLEKLCDMTDNIILFKKICGYLHKIGLLEDPSIYSDKNQNIRNLYNDYLMEIIGRIGKKKTALLCDEKKLQIMNSHYASNFIEIEKLGNGGFGEVYKTYNQIDTQQYAIKKIPFFDVNDPNNVRAFNEVKCLAVLNHPNIVRYYSSWLELSDRKLEIQEDEELIMPVFPILYIQMELCQCSLQDYLMKRNYSGNMHDMKLEFNIIKEIVDGLKYIHENGILHRDINPNNIFLTNNMQPKIGDFGMSIKRISDDIPTLSNDKGVSLYMPPEYVSDGIYTEKSDVYSLGIVIFEILQVFKTNMERIQIMSDVKKNIFPLTFVEQYQKYHKLLLSMLNDIPNERISSISIIL